MSTPETLAEKHARILGALAEYGLDFAAKLHGQGMAAEDPAATADLARAFHAVARTVRQTLALETRLIRERGRIELDDQAEARREVGRTADRCRNQVHTALEREIWNEHEEEEASDLVDDLQTRLILEDLAGAFADGDVEAHVVRLRGELGLSSAEGAAERAVEAVAGEDAPPTGAAPNPLAREGDP